MPLSLDIRAGLHKIIESILPLEVIDTPDDQYGRYLHQLGIYHDLIEENRQQMMNSNMGSLCLEDYERNQQNIVDLSARIVETRESYQQPKMVTQRKLFGRIPFCRKNRIVVVSKM